MENASLLIAASGGIILCGLYVYLAKKASINEEVEQLKTEVRKSYAALEACQNLWEKEKNDLEERLKKSVDELEAYRKGYVTEFKARAEAIRQLTEKADKALNDVPKKSKKKKGRNG